MAVLTPRSGPVPGLFSGAGRVLAAREDRLPQPDQLCGPFAAHHSLHAVLDLAGPVPSAVEIARRSGTAIWPYDVPDWRPAGARLDRTGWDVLPRADSEHESGTNAAGLAAGVEAVAQGRAGVVPVSGLGTDVVGLGRLLEAVHGSSYDVGVVANVDVGALEPERGWSVGHFVSLLGVHEARVLVADSYAELGEPGLPTGCRWVSVEGLVAGIAASPGRGLLLLVRPEHAAATSDLVSAAGLAPELWST